MYAGLAAFLRDLAGWIVGMVVTYFVVTGAKMIGENALTWKQACYYLVISTLNIEGGVCELEDVHDATRVHRILNAKDMHYPMTIHGFKSRNPADIRGVD